MWLPKYGPHICNCPKDKLFVLVVHCIRCIKKMSHRDFSLKSVLWVEFHFFQGCFIIKFLSPNHLDTLIIPIKNLKCPQNAKNASGHSERAIYLQVSAKYIYSGHAFFAFLGHLKFLIHLHWGALETRPWWFSDLKILSTEIVPIIFETK